MLTEQEKAMIDARIKAKKAGTQPTSQPMGQPSAALPSNSSLTPQDIEKANAILRRKGIEPKPLNNDASLNNNRMEEEKSGNIFSRAADKVNNLYEGYKNLPVIKQGRQIVGGVVGAAGTLIGGVAGAVGNPLANIAEGKPLFQDFKRDVVETAKSTGKFGYDIGSEGAAAAPLGFAGKAVSIPLAAAQGYTGFENVKEGYKSGDAAQMLQGGLEVGTAAVGARSALGSKGLFVNKNALSSVSDKFKAKQDAKVLAEKTEMYRKILGESKGEAKKSQNMFMRGQKRNVLELLAKEESIIEKTSDNKLDTTSARQDIRNKLDAAEHELTIELTKDPAPKHSIQELKQRAITDIQKRFDVTATERKTMIKELEAIIDDEITSRGQQAGSDVKLTDLEMNNFKRGLYKLAGDYTRSPSINAEYKTLARYAKEAIESKNKNEKVKSLHSREGDLLEIDKTLENAHGRVVSGGRLGKYLNKGLGAVIGSSFGPFGAMVGAEVADIVTDYKNNPARKTGGKSAKSIFQSNRPTPPTP